LLRPKLPFLAGHAKQIKKLPRIIPISATTEPVAVRPNVLATRPYFHRGAQMEGNDAAQNGVNP